MELSSFSPMPHRPCLLMKCAKATILLDAAVNFETLATFHPYTVIKKFVPTFPPDTDQQSITKMNTALNAFIDATPEVQPVSLEDVDIETLDAILISNWHSLFGLPFITERNPFHGVVYCTVPTKELGGLAMHEMQIFFSHLKSQTMSDELRKTGFWKKFPTCTLLDPTNWKPIFTSEEIERSLSRIVPISFGETKLVNGVIKCTAQSSGHSIGSCNWIIELESTKFGYISTSSSKSTHMRPADWTYFSNLDYLILTSLARLPEDPHRNCTRIKTTLGDALNQGGNVLFPVNSNGYVFDLLEVIIGAFEECKIPRDIPIYIISPVAANTLAFINIFTEWLKKEKAVKVYNPEEPFIFNELIKENRIKVYDSIYGNFSREYRSPCVVLAGHPSLHIGNVVNFFELWGKDKKSVVITTDPDYPLKEMYKPFRNLQIRAYNYPIETRLDMNYINEMLLPELKPKTLIIPKEYTIPIDPTAPENDTITYKNITTFGLGEKAKSFGVLSRKRALISDDLLRNITMEPKRAKMVSFSNLRGFLSTYDNDFQILSSAKSDNDSLSLPQAKVTGVLTPEDVIKALRNRNIKAEHGPSTAGEGSIVKIPKLKAEIRIAAGGHSSRIRCSSNDNRKRIQRILFQCLEEI